ncbi:filamentous hemagglutinin-like protein [Alcanivorax xiamenensis]|uniref:Filamentous hemagglutinin-like protein n=1 Tax=Alcanivorax xiamenensis TaxID=1177156 RepID=A0ABQ6YB91_9GAMM|nr:filamentous hemagglutinin family protein [Alcanivorax xiamenensis]KAF0807282.1 filamentous hemagglutinin-like protein [Alcanivorax xiamenensis]
MLTKNTRPARRTPVRSVISRKPLALAVASILAVGAGQADASSPRPFSPEWFAAARANTAPTARPLAQQRQARERLQHSINNVGRTAAAVAAQRAAQEAARKAAQQAASNIPNGLGDGGLKVDVNPDTAGWLNAKDPTQTTKDGHTTVRIEQTADKAILNWETFNVGRDTTVDFDQQANWAALNRVNDPNARPSQIQGRIQGDGTVMIVNRNGVVFSGSSQVNVRNLVAAAADISDQQFTERGLYVDTNGSQPTFTDAAGNVTVDAGASITTHEPESVTQGGGYVLLMGREVNNAGEITTRRGQTTLAAGEDFYIRKGAGTEANQASTTRGNEVASTWEAGSDAGTVTNEGLIVAREGDITLTGHDVRQQGVAMATTTVNTRGTVHLLNSASDTEGKVTLGEGAVTTVVIEDDGETALDNQRDALIESSAELDGLRDDMITGAFDNIGLMADRRDQSRVEIVSGGDVVFEKDSLTLATGGQIAVDAGRRTHLNAGSELDVSGSVGVKVAMESNNVLINVQGNEQRDSPDNRDNGGLNNGDVWVDRRNLIFVPAGTGGYETDRWYTAGGLLEVSGYLDTQGHGIGEWSAAGGTVLLGGSEVVTQTGSAVNLSGGTLDVQTGYIAKTWLKGADGRLYDAATAPASMLYTGIYQGYERVSERWGQTDAWRNPLIAPERQLENGYTVGRDAGTLIINAPTAVLEGDIVAEVFQGERQNQAQDAGRDSYQQAQNRVARRGRLAVGQYGQYGLENAYGSDIRIGDFDDISEQLTLESDLSERLNTVWLDAGRLNEQRLGGLDLVSGGSISVESDLTLAEGGQLRLVSGQVEVDASVTARGGDTALTNILMPAGTSLTPIAFTDEDGNSELRLTENGQLDARGLWRNGLLESGENWKQAYVDGGDVIIEGTQDVTLAEGSLIDVSSGAALKADGELLGGRGGDITLGANVPLTTSSGSASPGGGTLVLDGELRSYGVAGGGELILETGQAVVIGDGGLETNGVLQAGETAPVDLTLIEDLVVREGQPLPLDYSYKRTSAAPGEPVGDGELEVSMSDPLVTGEDWVVPDAEHGTFYVTYQSPAGGYQVAYSGAIVPAGSSIIAKTPSNLGAWAADYVVPADVFPNGVPLVPSASVVDAGSPAPFDITIEAGSVLARGTSLPSNVRVKEVLVLNEADFRRGFSSYDINGHQGVLVSEETEIDVAMPVLRLAEGAFQTSAYDEALETWQPELFLERPLDGELEQRGGASLALRSDLNGLGGAIMVAEGARLEVDPGQSLLLSGRNRLTVDGTLRAQSGIIQVVSSFLTIRPASGSEDRIEIGENAVLDASGLAYTATDARDRNYGAVLDGGEVVLGAEAPEDFGDANLYDINNLFVVVREGALIDVSGVSAGLDLGQPTATTVASDGGSLAMRSNSGIYFDGELRADAGGANASGGGLEVLLEGTLTIASQATEEASVLRNITLTQADTGSGYDDENLAYGQARFSVDALQDSGIDHLSLWARDAILFDSDVDLALGGSLSLTAVTLATPDHTARQVRLAAPHVHLAGRVSLPDSSSGSVSGVNPYLQFDNNAPLAEGDSQLSVEAALIDLGEGVLTFGARGSHDTPNGATPVELPGFADITLTSTGDIRLTGADLMATEALTFISQRLYPTTHSGNRIRVGLGDAGINGGPLEDAVLRFRYYDEERAREQASPLSVYGYLSMEAPIIDQGAALYAPLGGIAFSHPHANQGGFTNYPTDLYGGITPQFISNLEMNVLLRQGSLTSVSAAGLVLPYGYLEGESYYYNGTEVRYDQVGLRGTEQNQRTATGIHFATATFEAEDGAVIDVSAGGELRGVGFTSGRGGSVDILNTALANAAPWHAGDADAQVYAIVPGLSDSQAPLDPALASHSKVGQQITIGDGVPGLPAGTYTLLPAEYALMPGGYRVELGGDMARYDTGIVASPAVGLYRAPVNTVNGLSEVLDSAPLWATVMSGDTLRRYGDYNETTLSEWVTNTLAQFGDTRLMAPLLPEDVRPLSFDFRHAASGDDRAFSFNGELRNTQVEDGRGGMVALYGKDLEVVAATGERDEADSGYITLLDEDLNHLGATVLGVGVNRDASRPSASGKTVIRSGATLRAGSLLVGGSGQGAVVVESGAVLDSRGQGQAGWSADNGFLISPLADVALLTVSNDRMQFGAASGNGTIRIEDGAGLYGEGTLALSAPGGLEIGDISLAASDLLLSMEDINIGEDAALAAAEAQGVLSGGWQLNQSTLDGLLALGELDSLSLQASDSINFIGSVSLDTYDDSGESQANLRFIGPAIYGRGGDGDTATIRTDQFIWSGLGYTSGREGSAEFEAGSVAPGEVIAGGAGTGTGAFRVEANEVMFGFNGLVGDQSANATLERLMLGFNDVTFGAQDRITSDLYGGLSVYQQKNSDDTFSGGNLTLSAPVLTGQAGSEMAYRTGGNLLVSRPDNAAAAAPADLDLGAQLSLEGNSVRVEGSIIAPSGKVAIESTEDLLLADGSLINVAGRAVEFFDVTKYSFGGAISLESAEGNVQQAAGSRIDVSAPYSDAGKLEATAANGTVDLAGELVARNPGEAPEGEGEGGTIRIKANTLPGFVALNQRLTDGGFDYLRGFETNEGDLTLGEEVRARHIETTANGGDLIVDGNLRAGGEYAGSIYLAAANDLQVVNGARLDASGEQLKLDSYGDPIEGSNRAIINLTSRDGRLVLGDNVTLDVSAGGEARGTIDLNARRLGAPSETSATGNDVAVDAGDSLAVSGAKRVSVNGFWSYDDAPDDPEGPAAQRVDQEYLDRIHEESKGFVNAALANDALQQRLANLKDAAGEAFSLRPGVEIVSATEDGNLRIDGDLDFSGYRYGPGVDEAVHGSGTAGVFVMRAGGDLEVNGSVTDGFKLPPNTPDSSYTLDFELDPGLLNGEGQLTQDFELEENLTLRSGWSLGSIHASGSPYFLPFDLTETLIQVSPNVQIPFDGELSGSVTLPFGATLPADIVLPVQINDLARPGTTYGPGLVPAGTTVGFVSLPAGTTIFQGSTFSVAMSFRPSVIPAGTDLQGINVIDAKEYGEDLQLETGFVLPKGFGISSFKGEEFEQPIWPMASAMNEGSESWDLRLVSGADLASASSRSTQVLTAGGDLILDNDYKVVTYKGLDADVVREGLSVIRTGTGDLELIASRDYLQNSRFSIYTGGTAVEGAPALGAERTEDGTVLNTDHALYEDAAAAATALINTSGGNVLVQVGRDIQGYESNGETGHWLWAASGTETGNQQVWGINPGNYGLAGSGSNQYLDLLGFDGIGTLGGGNLTVTAGGDVGAHTRTSDGQVLGGVFLMVGGAGWVDGEGQRHTYGGGDLKLDVAGIIDPVFLGNTLDQGGVANLRGDVQVRAEALGELWQTYDVASYNTDPRPDDELLLVNKRAFGGLRLVLGDARATLHTRGDALVNVQDPSTNGVVLRTDHTEALVLSTGGDIGVGGGSGSGSLPARFSAVAAGGSVYGNGNSPNQVNLTTDVSSNGWLEILARESIYTLGLSTVYDASLSGLEVAPARFYALEGDIYQLYYGYYGVFGISGSLQNRAGRPAHVRAGRDIVEYGGGEAGLANSALGHYSPTDVSIIEAGRDLIHINTQVIGPGTLELTAGRNVYQADRGWVRSVGPFSDGTRDVNNGGADIVVNAGMGESGPDYQALIDTYLDPANLAEAGRPLAEQPDKVVKVYDEELRVWLEQRFGLTGLDLTDALAYFQNLAPEQQRIFLRELYYAELREGGREYTDSEGPRFGSYLRGRRVIETLLPEMDSEMGTSGYQGDFTMFTTQDGNTERSGLIRTEGGGDIQMLVPGGDLIIGLESVRAENGDNGILTQGSGDIQLFSQGDIALGLSRIMTTYGGDIFAWSNAGDINAGRGAKTTLVYTPPRRTYDSLGNVTLSPSVPSTGAGIATLAPIPEVPPGDIDLIAPLGVIDAGEAGIRVSGSINVAALQVVNAENIQVQGDSTGLPAVAAVNVGALTSASNAASSAVQAAEQVGRRYQQQQPSIINVEILGYGEERLEAGGGRTSAAPASRPGEGMVEVLGAGPLSANQMGMLTPAERRGLKSR